MHLYAKDFLSALRKTYGWKPVVEKTKSDEPSLLLWLVACSMFVIRLTWLSQLSKLIYRSVKTSNAEVPPLLAEIYILASLAIEVAVGVSTYYQFAVLHASATLVGAVCLWKIFENLTSNFYYLLLRPVLELKAPHSTYRSFLIAVLALIEVWLLLSLLWYFVGITNPKLDSFLTAIYFTTATFFTVGFGDYSPAGDLSHALAVFTMFAAAMVLAIVLSRALSLVRPLPSPADHP